jgi:hypothetical protein
VTNSSGLWRTARGVSGARRPGVGGFAGPPVDHYGGMDLRRPLLLLAVAGSLVACGDNTDLQRGETNCDSTSEEASNPNDASCQETGTNDDTE